MQNVVREIHACYQLRSLWRSLHFYILNMQKGGQSITGCWTEVFLLGGKFDPRICFEGDRKKRGEGDKHIL